MNTRELELVGKLVAGVVKPLQARIAELESQTQQMRYLGVFDETASYVPGNFVTHRGGVWHCNTECTGIAPGSDEGAASWTLAVKGRR